MIPKKTRTNREIFEKVMKKGGFLNSGLFSLRFLKNPENTTSFSVVVAKKIAKTAILRNKIRRRAYSVLKRVVKNPYQVILFGKKGVEKATFSETESGVLDVLKRAKII